MLIAVWTVKLRPGQTGLAAGESRPSGLRDVRAARTVGRGRTGLEEDSKLRTVMVLGWEDTAWRYWLSMESSALEKAQDTPWLVRRSDLIARQSAVCQMIWWRHLENSLSRLEVGYPRPRPTPSSCPQPPSSWSLDVDIQH